MATVYQWPVVVVYESACLPCTLKNKPSELDKDGRVRVSVQSSTSDTGQEYLHRRNQARQPVLISSTGNVRVRVVK